MKTIIIIFKWTIAGRVGVTASKNAPLATDLVIFTNISWVDESAYGLAEAARCAVTPCGLRDGQA